MINLVIDFLKNKHLLFFFLKVDMKNLKKLVTLTELDANYPEKENPYFQVQTAKDIF